MYSACALMANLISTTGWNFSNYLNENVKGDPICQRGIPTIWTVRHLVNRHVARQTWLAKGFDSCWQPLFGFDSLTALEFALYNQTQLLYWQQVSQINWQPDYFFSSCGCCHPGSAHCGSRVSNCQSGPWKIGLLKHAQTGSNYVFMVFSSTSPVGCW